MSELRSVSLRKEKPRAGNENLFSTVGRANGVPTTEIWHNADKEQWIASTVTVEDLGVSKR